MPLFLVPGTSHRHGPERAIRVLDRLLVGARPQPGACRKVFLHGICKGGALCQTCIEATRGRNAVA